ncbi:DNA-nicking Smr family endonuclease [Acidovorax sp. 100]|uniref:Smr/MutS family protein n=1 Tax=unclassified Acidovorax TaxID=2684926 RepID=UPI000EFA1A69|nr:MULTISPECIES: Smr/MutS family protein [unclassified Acidovorax]MBD9403981.1 Smr/MutS family protein [Acidovorax sp. ACV02]RMA63208.1 DNA-nicking Smr family endonuclease [Acidovorax sp. 100]
MSPRPSRSSIADTSVANAANVIHSLQDLKQIRKQLEQDRAEAAAHEKARQEADRRARDAHRFFELAVGPVHRMRPPGTVEHEPKLPPPIPVQHQLDEQRVLLESISDDFDVSSLLETDEALSFRRPGVGPDITRRLRKGEWTLQAQLDLHGLRTDEAREALGQFLRDAQKQGKRCVRVVHGKGLGSPGKSPVLKGRVHSWLVQKNEVLAFVQARGDEGGAGALVVLLRSARKMLRNRP